MIHGWNWWPWLVLMAWTCMSIFSCPGTEAANDTRQRRYYHPTDPYAFLEEEIGGEESMLYGPGYHMLRDYNGCGGRIHARPGYQYGQLVSPNWPLPYPAAAHCEWTFHGFDHIVFFISDLNIVLGKDTDAVGGLDRLTLHLPLTPDNIPHDFPRDILLCGSVHQMDHEDRFIAVKLVKDQLLNVSFISKPTTYGKGTGFVLTWMKFPALGFAGEIYGFGNSGYKWIPVGANKTGYFIYVPDFDGTVKGSVVIYVTTKPGSSLDALCNDTGAAVLHFAENLKAPLKPLCDLTVNKPHGFRLIIPQIFSHVKARIPGVVIELNLMAAVDQVAFSSSKIELDSQSKAGTCKFQVSSNSGISSFLAPVASFPSRDQSTDGKSQRCQHTHPVIAENLKNTFIQVAVMSALEESPECVHEYLQVGGKRICGGNYTVQTVVSPSGRRILESVGSRYVNIIDLTMTANGAAEQLVGSYFQHPLSTNLSSCYRSKSSTGYGSFWEVDLGAPFLVHTVSITKDYLVSNDFTEIILYNKRLLDSQNKYPVTCWSGQLRFGPTPTFITCKKAPLYGQYVTIQHRRHSEFVLCNVQVFVDAAEPIVHLPNVARHQLVSMKPSGRLYTSSAVVDGQAATCLWTNKHDGPPRIWIDLHEWYRVYAVRIVTNVAEVQRKMAKSWNPKLLDGIPKNFVLSVYAGRGSSEGQHCRSVTSVTTDNTLINCEHPVEGSIVAYEQLKDIAYLCELLVYAMSRDITRNNVAPYRNGFYDNEIVKTSVAADGNVETCRGINKYALLDLGSLHVVDTIAVIIGDNFQCMFALKVFKTYGEFKRYLDPFGEVDRRLYSCEKDDVLHSPLPFQTTRVRCDKNRIGRYVMIYVTRKRVRGNSLLSLCELQVGGEPQDLTDDHEGLMNVALFKLASFLPRLKPWSRPAVSLSSGEVKDRSARGAVDGMRNSSYLGFSCIKTGHAESGRVPGVDWMGEHAIWFVDLGNLFRVREVYVTPCDSAQQNGSYDVQLHIKSPAEFLNLREADNFRLKKCQASWSLSSVWRGVHVATYKCRRQALSRYVTLVFRLPLKTMCLCEVEVMAKPLATEERFGVHLPFLGNKKWLLNFNFFSDETKTAPLVKSSTSVEDLSTFKTFVDCGTMIQSLKENTEVVVSSPNYPDPYAGNNDSYVCQYAVHIPVDGFTEVEVQYLTLARHPEDDNTCFADRLVISNEAGQEQVLCGDVFNRVLKFQTFEDEFLVLTFMVRTPEVNASQMNRSEAYGFSVRIMTYPDCSNIEIEKTPQPYGFIGSPLYPRRIASNVDCRWVFKSKERARLEFIFLDFVVVGGKDCAEAHVTIYNYDKELGVNDTQAKFCTERPPSTGLIVYLKEMGTTVIAFTSGSVNYGRGFSLKYQYIPANSEREFEILDYQESPSKYSVKKTQTLTFSLLANVGDINIDTTSRAVDPCSYLRVERSYGSNTKFHQKRECRRSYFADPFTMWTFQWPGLKHRQDNVNLSFSFKLEKTKGQPKLFVGRLDEDLQVAPGQLVELADVRQQSHINSADNKRFYVLESGLYVISIRVHPEKKHTIRMELLVNNDVPGPFRVLAYTGSVGCITGTFRLHKGDDLSVRALDTGLLKEYTLLTIVYVSPVEGGFAFTGIKAGTPADRKLMGDVPFKMVLTSVGQNDPTGAYTFFTIPRKGIYWISMRPEMYGCTKEPCQSSAHLMLSKKYRLYAAYTRHNVPSSLSVADSFKKGDVLSVYGQTLGKPETLFSVTYLAFNKHPYTDPQAFTGRLSHSHSGDSDGSVVFDYVILNAGGMFNNSDEFRIHYTGYYLVSLRPIPGGDTMDLTLSVLVNGGYVFTGYTADDIPMGQTTVLPLRKGDKLSVYAGGGQTAQKNTLFSMAFVHPDPTV